MHVYIFIYNMWNIWDICTYRECTDMKGSRWAGWYFIYSNKHQRYLQCYFLLSRSSLHVDREHEWQSSALSLPYSVPLQSLLLYVLHCHLQCPLQLQCLLQYHLQSQYLLQKCVLSQSDELLVLQTNEGNVWDKRQSRSNLSLACHKSPSL